MSAINNHETDELFRAILSLKTIEECYLFFEDVCTIKEVRDMSQRLSVARALSQNKNYNEVSRETGASSATISRVNRCLMYGQGGYKLAMERTPEEAQSE